MRSYLKELRKKAGLTQADVAEKIGVGASTYTMIEHGERQKQMSIKMAEKIAGAIGCDVSVIWEQEKVR